MGVFHYLPAERLRHLVTITTLVLLGNSPAVNRWLIPFYPNVLVPSSDCTVNFPWASGKRRGGVGRGFTETFSWRCR